MPVDEYRVIGPPGCGKTTWLASQVEAAASHRGSNTVLITSLTRAAASEVAGRKLPIPREHVGTLHAHAYRSLGHPKIFASGVISEWNKAHPAYSISVDDADLDEASVDGRAVNAASGDEVFTDYTLQRTRVRPREAWAPATRMFASAFEAWKRANEVMDFTDLIERATLDTESALSGPSVIFADETQDYSKLEMALLRRWARAEVGVERLVIVGDPDQNLYEWRGSDPLAFQDPPVDGDHRRVLKQSYRVPKAVHAAAVAWIRRSLNRPDVEYLPRDFEGSVTTSRIQWTMPAQLIDSIEADLKTDRSIMVLTSCSYMLVPILRSLREAGIPFWNPRRVSRGDWNPLRYGAGGAVSRFLSYVRPDDAVWGDLAHDWTAGDVRDWSGAMAGLFSRRGAPDVGGEFRGIPDDSPVTLDELATLLKDPENAALAYGFMAGDYSWFEAHLSAAYKNSMLFPIRVAQRRGAATLRRKPHVAVGTVHSVKGWEADKVYLFPDLSKAGFAQWMTQGGVNAVRRQFYVGMTRAKEELVLCAPSGAWSVQWNA